MDLEMSMQIPIILAPNYEKHLMATAEVTKEGDSVTINISAEGAEAVNLVDFLTNGEPVGLSFVPIPVARRGTHT